MTGLELARQLKATFGSLISDPVEFRGETTVRVQDPERITEVCLHAKSAMGFDFLKDISSVDCMGETPRWLLVYELYGLKHATHLRVQTAVEESVSEVPSVVSVWKTANWHEREIFDMMGIRFRGHPDLRRILMWDGYPHHPLRKDFPVEGCRTEPPGGPETQRAPIEGGPFVTTPGAEDAAAREPRARRCE